MKKTYFYIIIAVAALILIAAILIPQITKKTGPGNVTPEQQAANETNILEAEGPMQAEGKELNAINVDTTDLQEIDTEINKL